MSFGVACGLERLDPCRTLRQASAIPILALAAALCIGLAADARASSLHFEIANANGINAFSSYNYICTDCTQAQYDAMVLPPGFAKRNTRILVPETAGGLPGTPPDGVPAALDLVPDLPGDDFLYCCEVLEGAIVGVDAGAGVLFNTARVRRDNVFIWAAGSVVHELVDPEGARYAMFLIDQALAGTLDLGTPGALSGLPLPPGWSYESRVLAAPLQLSAPDGVVDNFGHVAVGVGVLTAFQRYEVPEPGTLSLLSAGLALLAGRRRRAARS